MEEVRQTSLLAYEQIKKDGTIGKQQHIILEALMEKSMTRREVENVTHITISSVCPRVRELLDMGYLVELGPGTCNISGKTAMVLACADQLPEGVIRKRAPGVTTGGQKVGANNLSLPSAGQTDREEG